MPADIGLRPGNHVTVAEIEDFDHFPIPFRAVATDVGTGEMVVLKSSRRF